VADGAVEPRNIPLAILPNGGKWRLKVTPLSRKPNSPPGRQLQEPPGSPLVVSGLLLFAADADAFLHSRIFWVKMGLMGTLLINGVAMLSGEQRVLRGDPRAWTRLHAIAVSSLLLWFLTALAGAALPNI
jgi:hypothetical protein